MNDENFTKSFGGLNKKIDTKIKQKPSNITPLMFEIYLHQTI